MLRAYTTQGDMSNDVSYNLYWGDEECSDEQMVLGMENITATSMVHNSNDNLRYNVTAVVDGRETDFSNTIYLGPSVTIEETPETDMFANVINGNIIINKLMNSLRVQKDGTTNTPKKFTPLTLNNINNIKFKNRKDANETKSH